MFIYETTNKLNGKKYIGLCSRSDDGYLGSGVILKQAINKYGKDNFERIILDTADSYDELLLKEEYYIKLFNAVESDQYYNLVDGGHAGNSKQLKEYWSSMTKEERKSARDWKGYWIEHKFDGYNDEWRDNVSKAVKEHWDKCSEEERKSRASKVSETRKKTGVAAGEKNPMYGRSAVREKNLKWYTNGIDNIYVTEGTQPESYRRGRTVKSRKNNADA